MLSSSKHTSFDNRCTVVADVERVEELFPSSSFFDGLQNSTFFLPVFVSNRTSAMHSVSVGDQGGEAQPAVQQEELPCSAVLVEPPQILRTSSVQPQFFNKTLAVERSNRASYSRS
ncbi:hypothetical protein J6590_101908 [Homalodisca vitripennis]|nr:hypothetical protein J6590_101908 [Homalodisca vitripennis]